MKHLIRLITALSILLILSACGGQANNAPTRDDIKISVMLPDERPVLGDTILLISVMDDDGSPIDNATVKVQGDMDHEGMDSVNGEMNRSSDGVYPVPFAWTMGGGWIVTVTVELPNNAGTAEQTFEYFVEAISPDSIINQDNMDMDANMDMNTDSNDN